jgi:hypothetical protein
VTSRALSRISATPDNDVVPMDPELVNQMENLCSRLGLAVSGDPEALLEHLVSWGHKVRPHWRTHDALLLVWSHLPSCCGPTAHTCVHMGAMPASTFRLLMLS